MMVMPKEDVTQAEVSKQAERLKKSHIFLMKHPKIMALSGIIIMGTSEVRANIPTAYTDGVNKKYGAGFMARCTGPQLNGLVMHENGHVFFRHVTHHKRLFRENPKLTNIAADLVVDDMIVLYEDKDIELPPGALWNPMFRNWSVTQVYDYLKKRKDELEDEGEGNPRPDGKPGPQGDGTGPQGNGSPSGETQNKQTDVDELLKRLGHLFARRLFLKRFAWSGGTQRFMGSRSLNRISTHQSLRFSSLWVAGELSFHLSVNT
jgi:predicted metal-dependent peptidase